MKLLSAIASLAAWKMSSRLTVSELDGKHLRVSPCLAFSADAVASANCNQSGEAEWPSLQRVGDFCVTLQTLSSHHQHQHIPSSGKGRAGANPCFPISRLPVPVVISGCDLRAPEQTLVLGYCRVMASPFAIGQALNLKVNC